MDRFSKEIEKQQKRLLRRLRREKKKRGRVDAYGIENKSKVGKVTIPSCFLPPLRIDKLGYRV